ncbi:MAG: hypothetical protein K6D96_10585 [Acetatifactor sp.]|nr:hypothetical protein [Acetatifactor sp.]
MIVIRVLFLLLLLFAAPFLYGYMLLPAYNKKRGAYTVISCILVGRIALWAVFFICLLPCILKGVHFDTSVYIYAVTAAVLGVIMMIIKRMTEPKNKELKVVSDSREPFGKKAMWLWILVAVIFVIQIVLAFVFMSPDGDDAYFVGESVMTVSDNRMFMKDAYTGYSTHVFADIRHSLAPFSLWMSMIAFLTKIDASLISLTILPVYLIMLAYGVVFVTGGDIFKKSMTARGAFMLFAEILILFGDYSRYSMENFMLLRSRQGKAELAAIVIPFTFWMLLNISKQLEKEKKPGLKRFVILICASATACLCSSLGAFLYSLFMAAYGIIMAICYKKLKLLFYFGASCAPCVMVAVMYLIF